MRPISTAPGFEYSFKKAASTRSPQERNTRLENMRWRIWNLVRRKKQAPKRGGKAPVAATKKKQEKVTNPLFEKRPEQFGIGRAIPPKRDLTRFVKWPKTVQIQRKKRSLKQRLKVPPPLKKITKTLDKNLGSPLLFQFILFYEGSGFAYLEGLWWLR
ncbi:60S ribosomal protein L7a [Morella rubra]|uniref:60S ribosomal protein L7a n=1 Tax=Morella rubra TaxID=262757 RepID=A0A6A1USG6_9ROSI|nr:60S ribosomal protein L7a [Morella rubra]